MVQVIVWSCLPVKHKVENIIQTGSKAGRYSSGEELHANEIHGPGKQEVEKTGI